MVPRNNTALGLFLFHYRSAPFYFYRCTTLNPASSTQVESEAPGRAENLQCLQHEQLMISNVCSVLLGLPANCFTETTVPASMPSQSVDKAEGTLWPRLAIGLHVATFSETTFPSMSPAQMVGESRDQNDDGRGGQQQLRNRSHIFRGKSMECRRIRRTELQDSMAFTKGHLSRCRRRLRVKREATVGDRNSKGRANLYSAI
jgi:hypothetical protein